MQFHEILAQLMDEQGISQSQLCRMTGIATSAMSHYVRGETEPSFTKAITIAHALNVPVDMLAGKVDQPALTSDEQQLVDLYRAMTPQYRAMLTKTARLYAADSEKEADVPRGARTA